MQKLEKEKAVGEPSKELKKPGSCGSVVSWGGIEEKVREEGCFLIGRFTPREAKQVRWEFFRGLHHPDPI